MSRNWKARTSRRAVAVLAGLCTPLLAMAGPQVVGDQPGPNAEAVKDFKFVPQMLPIDKVRPGDAQRAKAEAGFVDEHPEHLMARLTTAVTSRMPILRQAPPNDLCADAIDVGMLPAVVLGTTVEATPDPEADDLGFCGTTPGAPGVWYTVTGTGNTLTASLCSAITAYDSKINVYCGDCVDGLICVGGNDDSCGLQSQVSWCSIPGQTYYIFVNGFGGATGDFEMTVSDDGLPCTDPVDCVPPSPVPNDFCDTAIDVGALPASVDGTTIGATVDDTVAPECGTTVTAPGVWYAVTGTGNSITASLCGGNTSYDSKLSVYCGDCEVELFCVDGNDDFCGLQSEVTWCSAPGQVYFILVHGFSSNTGDFTLDVFDDGVACDNPPLCEPCQFACDPAFAPEGEPTCMDEYVDVFNGGCNSDPPVFSDVDCSAGPVEICGTTGNFTFTDPVDGPLDSRDTDWYRFTLASPQLVTVTMESGFNSSLVGIVNTNGIDDCSLVSEFLVAETAGECEVATAQALLPAGTWYVFASTADFVGVPCGSEYQLTITCEDPPAVACCFGDGTCADLLPADCAAQGGSPGALGSDCSTTICTTACCFADQSCQDLGPDDCVAAGGLIQGVGTLCADITCPAPPPPNDLCNDAIGPLAVPSSTLGTTIGATTDTDVIECDGAIITSPGVWYTVIGTGNTMTASICGGSIDVNDEAKITVYCGDCDTGLFCAGAFTNFDFDGCATSPTEVSWCSIAGEEYRILVHGFGGNEFDFDLLLSDDMTPCDNPPLCEPCTFDCSDPNAIPEGEPTCADEYNDTFNGGCNSDPPVFSDIACGEKICGESGTFIFTDPVDGPLSFRDTDWYRLVLTEPRRVTVSIEAGFEALIGIIDTGGVDACPDPVAFLESDVIDGCVLGSISADLEPGTWYIFAAPAVFEGVACGTQYELEVTCEALGGCCLPDPPTFRAPCVQTTEADCVDNLKGIYLGDGAACGGFTYNDATCANAFEDISATGTNTFIGDEQEILVPIGFNFNFYGVAYPELYISDNGYVSFTEVTGTSFSNQDIPDPDNPNNLIAPLWDDLDPASGGAVYYETLGTAPNRRFIVQWDQVPQFFDVDSNTFQVVLYESTGCVEFRYGLVTPEAFADDYTIGVENQNGFLATRLPGTVAVQGACVELCPEAGFDPCPKCIGDTDGDGDTDVFDWSALAGAFGQAVTPGTGGDVNGDGVVDIFDFMIISADFGCGTVLP